MIRIGALRRATFGTLVGTLVAFALAFPARARASIEEFSTFGVEAQEEDDESLLDHVCTRSPHEWRDEWERAAQAIRTSQGCLTSGQWFIDTDLKLRSPLGRRARLQIDLRQSESDAASYDQLDFSFRFPTRWGTPGMTFRPLHDKSRQDFAASWSAGEDTSMYQVAAVFTFEDMFNNLWAFRQTRVGQDSEPYERHPYEPALKLQTRQRDWRFAVEGRYLTPSRKRVFGYAQDLPARRVSLWGALGSATFEARALGIEWEMHGKNQQARSTDQAIDFSTGRGRNFRRAWSAEWVARRRLLPRLSAEAHFLYQERAQNYGPPIGPGTFAGIDRLTMIESNVDLTPALRLRVAGLFDRITIAHDGTTPWTSFGTRNESRMTVGLVARFGRVNVSALEGIELDPEPYDVWGVHDKGFVHLQTTF